MKTNEVELRYNNWTGLKNLKSLKYLHTSPEYIEYTNKLLESKFNCCFINYFFNRISISILLVVTISVFLIWGTMIWHWHDGPEQLPIFLASFSGTSLLCLIFIVLTCYMETIKLRTSHNRISCQTQGTISVIPKYKKIKKSSKGICCQRRILMAIRVVLHNEKLKGASDEQCKKAKCFRLNQPSWDSSIIVKPKDIVISPRTQNEASYLTVLSQNVTTINPSPNSITRSRNSMNRSRNSFNKSNMPSFNFSVSNYQANDYSNFDLDPPLSLKIQEPERIDQSNIKSEIRNCQVIRLNY